MRPLHFRLRDVVCVAVFLAVCLPSSGVAQSARRSPAQSAAQSNPRAVITPRPISTPRASTQNQGLREAGQTAETGGGRVGQRRSAREMARVTAPLGRISNRVQNRVQSRIANRIDENYDPLANTRSPFETAEDRARVAGRRPRN